MSIEEIRQFESLKQKKQDEREFQLQIAHARRVRREYPDQFHSLHTGIDMLPTILYSTVFNFVIYRL